MRPHHGPVSIFTIFSNIAIFSILAIAYLLTCSILLSMIRQFSFLSPLYCSVSTDCSHYVTCYLYCSWDTLFMTSRYPLHPENLFVHATFRSQNHLSFYWLFLRLKKLVL